MAPMLLFLIQLLQVSLAVASHYFGGTMTFTYKGRNPDGSLKVSFRNRETFDGCFFSHYWYCYSGNCGYSTQSQTGVLDRSANAPVSNREWCELETISTRNILSNQPFELREASCCWVSTKNLITNWRLLTYVDLGTRSDTRKPNSSPHTVILPFLRVPQNCPRTYTPMFYDPDGDQVRCRFGNIIDIECSSCSQPSGFYLDQDSCTLRYQLTNSNPSVYGFELVVEDFPQRQITLTYTDGTRSTRTPPFVRRKRQAFTTSPTVSKPSQTSTVSAAARSVYITPLPPLTSSNPALNYVSSTTQSATTRATYPLSKLPLQFSVLVDPPVPSCEEGAYIPIFVNPTPVNGASFQAVVNKEVEIRVKAQVTRTTISDIIVSGPLNITKHRTTHDEFVIRWTPVLDDLGERYPVCFAVESVTGFALPSYNHSIQTSHDFRSGVYQSEMRCVLVDVSKDNVKTNVICDESTIRVEVEKSSFSGLHEDHLKLSDSSDSICSLQKHSNRTHVIAVIPLNSCGTQIEEDDESLIFKNEITTFDNTRDVITRKHLLEVQFYCQYSKQGNVTLSFTAHRKNVTVWEKGFGTFTYRFEFYPDNSFETTFDPNSYPLEYDLGSRIYMQLEATSSVNNTELFVESCRAAPYDNPNYHPTYSIIENGCTVDPTVVVYPRAHERLFKFSMEAFMFIGLYDQVYISCSVMMCEAKNPNTRCSQRCINSTTTGGHQNHNLQKREAVIQSANHHVSQGPVRIRRSAESTTTKLNLNLVFIAGSLLAAVGMICGVALYRTKMSKFKYQPLSGYEN